jgi:hypothetical protein
MQDCGFPNVVCHGASNSRGAEFLASEHTLLLKATIYRFSAGSQVDIALEQCISTLVVDLSSADTCGPGLHRVQFSHSAIFDAH